MAKLKMKLGAYSKGQKRLNKQIDKGMAKAKKDRNKAYREVFGGRK